MDTYAHRTPQNNAGNLLAKYLDFNAFLFNLGPGVLLTSPPVFYYLVHYFKDNVSVS
jgi:hypothetical protein